MSAWRRAGLSWGSAVGACRRWTGQLKVRWGACPGSPAHNMPADTDCRLHRPVHLVLARQLCVVGAGSSPCIGVTCRRHICQQKSQSSAKLPTCISGVPHHRCVKQLYGLSTPALAVEQASLLCAAASQPLEHAGVVGSPHGCALIGGQSVLQISPLPVNDCLVAPGLHVVWGQRHCGCIGVQRLVLLQARCMGACAVVGDLLVVGACQANVLMATTGSTLTVGPQDVMLLASSSGWSSTAAGLHERPGWAA